MPQYPGKNQLATQRIPDALRQLSDCHLCAHHCGVNRLAGSKAGRCHTGRESHVFSAQTEVSDELEVIPTFAIAFSGCDMRCGFCITGRESWTPHAGVPFNCQTLAEQTRKAVQNGARSIMILGGEPTVHLHSVMELCSLLPEEVRWIWKTNAHGSPEAHALLEGLFDLWIADFKFGSDDCALRLSNTERYLEIIPANILQAASHTDLIIRHLVMPGHLDCCWKPVARWIADHLPGARVNLRGGFWPAWQAGKFPEFKNAADNIQSDWNHALKIAEEHQLRLTY